MSLFKRLRFNMDILKGIIFAMLFYAAGFILIRDFFIPVLLCPFGFAVPKSINESKRRKKNIQNAVEFKDMILSVSSSLGAGSSVEKAFREAAKDLEVIYGTKKNTITGSIKKINNKMNINFTIEEVLYEYASNTNVEDIKDFADVFSICKRTGGNLVEVILNSVDIISYKLETYLEIEAMLAEKRLERKILMVMPPAIMGLIMLTSKDYMLFAYQNMAGKTAFALALVLMLAAWVISGRILKIEV